MTSERWQQIEQLYHAALERAADERAAFLDVACDGDPALRQEVVSLLAYDGAAQHFISTPPDDLAAELLAAARFPSLIGSDLNHYRILSRLGRGGMGEVYLAADMRLGRKVAVKLLPSEFMLDAGRVRRFEQEARAASALNHPNILTIHEIGEAVTEYKTARYIVTEYIEGETLRERMRHGPLSLTVALDVAQQVASALTAAHAAGIVHRDIKPENVMVRNDGLVKVLDFGLAKPVAVQVAAVDTNAPTAPQVNTQSGVMLGTVSYMSPEQARGQKVDHRTDIFSLGVLLYEMVAGCRPFEGATMSDVIAALLTAEPPPLRQHCAGAPAKLEQIVGECLAKDREDRYQAAEELLVELKALRPAGQTDEAAARRVEASGTRFALRHWPVIAAIAAVLVVGLIYFLSSRRASIVQPDQIKSLAVLPLENLSGDPAQEYFADGMTEAIINNLTQIRALNRVISRTSMMRYKGSRKSLPEIAAELKVDAVIEGTVLRSGGRVRVTAKLIPAATDSPVWTREYNRDLSDVLKLQSDVARTVADEIRIQVTPEERARLTSARSIDPKAHEAYLLGGNHLRFNDEDLRQAIEHFERAIKLAPDYAAAYAQLSRAWSRRGIFGFNRKEAMPPARDAALKAVALDSQLPEGHVALGFVKTLDWDWAGAEQELTRALELDPNSAWAHLEYADLLMALERHDEAIREIERAEQLDPLSSVIQSRYGRVLYRARKYREAEPHLQRAIDLDPNPGNSMPYWILGELYAQMGRDDEAIANFKKYQSHGGRAVDVSVGIAGVYARMGKRNEARRMLAELKAQTSPASFLDVPVARAYAAIGDKDEAFKVLFRQVEERNNVATYVKADPPFESLHSDRRWKELLRRMNFPEERPGR